MASCTTTIVIVSTNVARLDHRVRHRREDRDCHVGSPGPLSRHDLVATRPIGRQRDRRKRHTGRHAHHGYKPKARADVADLPGQLHSGGLPAPASEPLSLPAFAQSFTARLVGSRPCCFRRVPPELVRRRHPPPSRALVEADRDVQQETGGPASLATRHRHRRAAAGSARRRRRRPSSSGRRARHRAASVRGWRRDSRHHDGTSWAAERAFNWE